MHYSGCELHVQTPQARATWALLAMNSRPITVDVSRHRLTHVHGS